MTGQDREFDVVLVGATGFTGTLTAEHLARYGGDARWAIAGRSEEKLAALRERLGSDVATVRVDVSDRGQVTELARRTKVLATTVGPYVQHGEPLVAACASAGTDYVDLTGEPEFVDEMYLRHHKSAEASGARLVHACGFDSVPHDLGALFTVQQLPEGVPLEVSGYVRASGRPSGGTLASAMTAFSRGRQMAATAKRRRSVEPKPDGRSVRAIPGRPRLDRAAGGWVVPFPSIDPQIVKRSAAALDRYGPGFRYSHYVVVRTLPSAVGLVGGAAGLFAAAQVPPARKWIMSRLPAGDGPSEEQRKRSWFAVRFVGEGGGERVVTEVAGPDPGYDGTAIMLAQSALCLAHDNLPETAGQVTTAVAMGDALITRLREHGITFTVVDG